MQKKKELHWVLSARVKSSKIPDQRLQNNRYKDNMENGHTYDTRIGYGETDGMAAEK